MGNITKYHLVQESWKFLNTVSNIYNNISKNKKAFSTAAAAAFFLIVNVFPVDAITEGIL